MKESACQGNSSNHKGARSDRKEMAVTARRKRETTRGTSMIRREQEAIARISGVIARGHLTNSSPQKGS